MSKLFFRYGAMNSGKSTALLQVAHNYEERGQSVVLVKPSIDTKGGRAIVSRLGVTRDADILLTAGMDFRHEVRSWRDDPLQQPELAGIPARRRALDCILIDEAQFLTPRQVDQALSVAVFDGIPVIAYGIRTDFQTNAFPGSRRLLEVAHKLEEMKTICRCGLKALFNARLTPDGVARDGAQVMIDGAEARYEARCARCFYAAFAPEESTHQPQ